MYDVHLLRVYFPISCKRVFLNSIFRPPAHSRALFKGFNTNREIIKVRAPPSRKSSLNVSDVCVLLLLYDCIIIYTECLENTIK